LPATRTWIFIVSHFSFFRWVGEFYSNLNNSGIYYTLPLVASWSTVLGNS
jgi:hypothetical protein